MANTNDPNRFSYATLIVRNSEGHVTYIEVSAPPFVRDEDLKCFLFCVTSHDKGRNRFDLNLE